MDKRIFADTDALAKAVADEIVDLIAATLQKQDRFTFVLSGGSTPKKLYELLASDEYRHRINWQALHFFWGDERCVPFTDERSNARMSYKTLLDKVPVINNQIHVMRTDMPGDESSVMYEEILHDYFGENPAHTFDLVLLGMGGDGHTLSLFPGYPIVHESGKWVDSFYLEEQNMYRITLTKTVVNKAANVFFLVAGADKASALEQVLNGPADPDHYPSQVIKPENGKLSWFLDEAAAGTKAK